MPQDSATSHMSHHDVQALRQQLDNALRTIRDHEDTILHQAKHNRQFLSLLKTQHGIICPDCKQEIAHECFSNTSSSLQQLTARYEPRPSSTFSNPVVLSPLCPSQGNQVTAQTLSTTQENSPYVASVSFRPTEPPHGSVNSPASISHLNQSYAQTSGPPGAFSSKSGTSSSLLSSKPINPHFSTSCLGKRNPTDLDYESGIKKARWNFPSQNCATSSVYPPSFKGSSLPATTTFAESILQSSTVPKPLPVTFVDRESIERRQEIGENWGIVYNQKVRKAVDVRPVRAFHVKREYHEPFSVTFSKDGKYLAVGFGHNGRTIIYDVQTGQEFCTLRDLIGDGKEMSIYNVVFSPDGLYLATEGVFPVFVRIWKISKKHVRSAFKFPRGSIFGLDFSPDSRHIALGIHDDYIHIRIYNMRDGSQKTLEVREKMSNSDVYFSPDGRYIAVGTSSGHVLLWNVRAGQLVERLAAHQKDILTLAFSPDGAGLVSGGDDRAVRFWDISSLGIDRSGLRDNKTVAKKHSGNQVLQWRSTRGANRLAVSPNGRWVLSSSLYGTICIWDAHKPDLLCELIYRYPDSDYGFWAEFSTNTNYIVSVSPDDEQLLLWQYEEI